MKNYAYKKKSFFAASNIILALIVAFQVGCSRTVNYERSVSVLQETVKNKPKFYNIEWYDTGDSCLVKLQDANSQIIRMDNKLYTVEKQLENLKKVSN